jgi:FMN phosphatase YigB (HAD superfamily)
MGLDYEKDIQIDPEALDVEWLRQGRLALRYGKNLVNWRERVNRLEEKKKTTRSELVEFANRNPQEACEKDKPTMTDIEAYYRNHKDYKDVIEELIDAKSELEMAEIAHKEISVTRKGVLEHLVRLFLANYFVGPTIPRDINKEWEDSQKDKATQSKIKTKRERR